MQAVGVPQGLQVARAGKALGCSRASQVVNQKGFHRNKYHCATLATSCLLTILSFTLLPGLVFHCPRQRQRRVLLLLLLLH